MFNSTKLQSLINVKGLGNIEFASKVGLTRSELANIMEGGDVSLSMVERIAEALGVKPAELINGTSSNVESEAMSQSDMEKELIELRAENKLLRELQGLPARRMANVG